jgi:hyperosmotically inducible protein
MLKSTQLATAFGAALLLVSATYSLAGEDALTDTAITALVKNELGSNYSNVSVTTENDGIVTLTGTVNATVDAETVIEKAESVKGVKDVNADNLQVKGSQQLTEDIKITAKAKGLLMREGLLRGKSNVDPWITVETTNGSVSLSGHVKSKAQIDSAINIAKSIDGVTDVKTSGLKVKSS